MRVVRAHHPEHLLVFPAKDLVVILHLPLNLVQDLSHVHVHVLALHQSLHLVLVLDPDRNHAPHLNHVVDQNQDLNHPNQEILLGQDLDPNQNQHRDLDLDLLLNHGQDRDQGQSPDRGHDLIQNQGLQVEVVVFLVVVVLQVVLKVNK